MPTSLRSGARCVAFAVLFATSIAFAAPVSREERLGDAPPGSPLATVVSADGRHRAELMRSGAEMFVMVDGRRDPIFTRVEDGTIVLGATGRCAYLGYRGEQPVMVVDGRTQLLFEVVGAPEFSPDGEHVAWMAQTRDSIAVVRDGVIASRYGAATTRSLVIAPDTRRVAYVLAGAKPRVVVDGVAGPEVDGIAEGSLTFSPGSRHVVFVTQSGKDWTVVVDGRKGPALTAIAQGSLAFSPDDAHVAYVGQRDGRACVVLDDRAGPAFDEIAQGPPRFSPDGRHLVYLARRGKSQHVVIDGNAGPAFDEIAMESPRFSPDGRRFAYVARQGAKWRVVIDGKASAPFDGVATGSPRFGSDGRVAYGAHVDGIWKVTVDDRTSDGYEGFDENSLVVGPAGGKVAYGIRRGHGAHAVIDGEVGPAFDLVLEPVLSPDGKRVAYLAQTGTETTLMVDGKPAAHEPWAGEGGPVFSRDGRRVAYIAKRGAQWSVVADGTPGAAFDGIHPGTLRGTGTGFEYLATRAGSLFRVTVE